MMVLVVGRVRKPIDLLAVEKSKYLLDVSMRADWHEELLVQPTGKGFLNAKYLANGGVDCLGLQSAKELGGR